MTRSLRFELIQHECLYQAEQACQLPLRLIMFGLYTFSDEEHRFCWCPSQLKLDISPHDDFDFAKALDVLAKYGFILKYEVQDKTYGYIPSRKKHPCIKHMLALGNSNLKQEFN